MEENLQTTTAEKQPGKLSLFFAKLYFVTTIISLLIFTVSSVLKIIKNGWGPATYVQVGLIAANYISLFVCMVFASNAKSAKANYAKAKKGLKVGKKLVKVVNAGVAVSILFTAQHETIMDYVELSFGILTAAMAVIGLISSIVLLIIKARLKKKKEAKKAAKAEAKQIARAQQQQKINDVKNKVKGLIYGNKQNQDELDSDDDEENN